MKALIEGTRVAQLASETFPVAAPLIWAGVPDDTTLQDTFVNGAVVKYVAPTPGYKQRRRSAYASVEEQLDMMYADLINGTATWRDHIVAVKALFPAD